MVGHESARDTGSESPSYSESEALPVRKVTGQIDEGWLGTDRSSDERRKVGSKYVMDIVIGPMCQLQFQVVARSVDEAKGIVSSLLQFAVDWDELPTTPLEAFWNETVPPELRSLSAEARRFIATHCDTFGEEKVKGAIITAARRAGFVRFESGDALSRYTYGILRKGKTGFVAAEPVHLKGVVVDADSERPATIGTSNEVAATT
jgi:hypothetical protein